MLLARRAEAVCRSVSEAHHALRLGSSWQPMLNMTQTCSTHGMADDGSATCINFSLVYAQHEGTMRMLAQYKP